MTDVPLLPPAASPSPHLDTVTLLDLTLGTLSPEAEEAALDHTRACDACAAAARRHEDEAAALRAAHAGNAPARAPALEARILAAVRAASAAAAQGQAARRTPAPVRRGRGRELVLVAAAGVVAVVGLALAMPERAPGAQALLRERVRRSERVALGLEGP